jgi:hypothetical protein
MARFHAHHAALEGEQRMRMQIRALLVITLMMLAAIGLAASPADVAMAQAVTPPSTVLTYVPVTITNSQTSATPAPFQQMINVTSSNPLWSYINTTSGYVASNVVFFYPNGTVIPSWLESYNPSHNPPYMLFWIKLSAGIPASSSVTIYMGVGSLKTNYYSIYQGTVGEAPELSPTYGEYDDGANVFPILYQNFAGTSLPSGWVESGKVTINNGASVAFGGYLTTSGTYGLNPNQILDAGFLTPSANAGNAWYQIGYVSQAGGFTFNSSTAIAWAIVDAPPYFVAESGGGSIYACAFTQFPTGVGNANTVVTGSIYWGTTSSSTGWINYGSAITQTKHIPSSPLYIGINNNQATGSAPPVATLYWIRLRAYPPNGVMPHYIIWPPSADSLSPTLLNILPLVYQVGHDFLMANIIPLVLIVATAILFLPILTHSRMGMLLRRNWGMPFILDSIGLLAAAALADSSRLYGIADHLSDYAVLCVILTIVLQLAGNILAGDTSAASNSG